MMTAYKAALGLAEYNESLHLTRRLAQLNVSHEELLGIVESWESRRLIASKRLVTTFAVSLTLVAVLGLNYSELNLLILGPLTEKQGVLVSVALALLVSYFFVAYLINLSADQSAREARLDPILPELSEGLKALERLETLVDAEKFPRVAVQREGGGNFQFMQIAGNEYQVVRLYRERIVAVDSLRRFLNKAECLGLSALAGYGFGGIVGYWLSI